ncbi:MAG TPA: GlsB/YeaQ/YmgE family stress response membrane protein [Terriglobia bacterium]
MIGMNFESFLTLLIISLIAALIMHYAIGYRVLDGFDGFLWKWVAGWLGAWLGTPVLGHWFQGIVISDVYIVPALLGGFIAAFLAAAVCKAEAKAITQHVG